jgi:hypothetical protein
MNLPSLKQPAAINCLLLFMIALTPGLVPDGEKQEPKRPVTIEQVMTPQQLKDAGIAGLKPSERAVLDTWLREYTARAAMATSESSFVAGVGADRWVRSEVIPVVVVESGIGGFKPIEGSSIGNTWTKSQVKPVVLVKPGIGGLVPLEGSSIGNTWAKNEVLPVALLESSSGGFAPLFTLRAGGDSAPTADQSGKGSSSPSLIEGKVDGEFEGWDGETVVKLTNGQFWQQTEYHYHYHYAFMPEVLIFKVGESYKMKVEGTDKAVGVTRLK